MSFGKKAFWAVSFLGGISIPAHPWIRPCPLPNETNGEEQARRNAYLQLLTNEAGLYAAETASVPPKLRPYVRELARYQTNPLKVPIVSLRNLGGGDGTLKELLGFCNKLGAYLIMDETLGMFRLGHVHGNCRAKIW